MFPSLKKITDGFAKFLSAPAHTAAATFLEPALLTVAAIWLGHLTQPQDPYFLYEAFPWPFMAFLLIGLRYGFMVGLLSSVVYLMALLIASSVGLLPYESVPYGYITGLLVATMITGEFRDLWQRRLQLHEAASDFAQLRLQEFTRSYHLLKFSHDQLEQQMAGSRQSLREAISEVVRLTRNVQGQPLVTETVAKGFLGLVTVFGHADEVALFRMAPTEASPTALALLVHSGLSDWYELDDPLLKDCCNKKKIVTIAGEGAQYSGESVWQAVIPVVDSGDNLWGVIAVRQMPFWAFEDKTLRLLGVMAGYVADCLSDQLVVRCNAELELNRFLANVQRCLFNAIKFSVPSVVVTFRLTLSESVLPFVDLLRQAFRGIDSLYEARSGETLLLLVLMPLTDEAGYEGFRRNLEASVRRQFNMSVTSMPVSLQHHCLLNAENLNTFFREHISNDIQAIDSNWSFT